MNHEKIFDLINRLKTGEKQLYHYKLYFQQKNSTDDLYEIVFFETDTVLFLLSSRYDRFVSHKLYSVDQNDFRPFFFFIIYWKK